MASNVTTLYIDDTSIRVLVATSREIKKWAEMPLQAGMVKDGVIIEESEVASKIKELLKNEKVNTRKIVTCLSGRHCLARLITLPRLPKSLLAEAVRREAERLLPVPLEQLYLSWQVVHSGAEETQIFLIAFPRNASDALTKTLTQAGLDPYLIDVKPLALARVVGKPTAIVVDVQPTELDIVVVVDRIPQLIRNVPLPSERQSQQKILAVVKEELDRTIKFYNSSHEEQPLDPNVPILISGNLVKDSESGATLVGGLKSFAEPLPSPIKYHRAAPPSHYMVNIGLVLKESPLPKKKASGSLVNLNALPQVYMPKSRSLTQIIFVPGVIIAVSLLAYPIMLVQSAAADTASLQTQLDVTNKRYAQTQTQKKVITELKGKVDSIESAGETYTRALERFEQQHEIVNNDLPTATSGLSSSLELSNMAHTTSRLVISGVASDETLILGYAERLRDSERFAQVIVTSIEKAAEERYNFTLTLTK
ncbi:MAG: pilus assembly protein PilM [Chloroflexi bacterium]|nr:pilus assembly protein PilM [Chloroflexota bacterium]